MENTQNDEQKLQSYKLKLLTATEADNTKEIKYYSVKVKYFTTLVNNNKKKEVAHITGIIYDETFKQEWIDDMKQRKIEAINCYNEAILFIEEQKLEKKLYNQLHNIIDPYEEYNEIQAKKHRKEHKALNKTKIYFGGLYCDYEAQIGPAFFDISGIRYYIKKVLPDIHHYKSPNKQNLSR